MIEENSLIWEIAKGKMPEDICSTKYGEFTYKYPSGKDTLLIEKKKADQLGGRGINQFNMMILQRLEIDMTLSVVITSYPEKFPKEFQGDNLLDFPDEEVKNALYKSFITFSDGIQKRISG